MTTHAIILLYNPPAFLNISAHDSPTDGIGKTGGKTAFLAAHQEGRELREFVLWSGAGLGMRSFSVSGLKGTCPGPRYSARPTCVRKSLCHRTRRSGGAFGQADPVIWASTMGSLPPRWRGFQSATRNQVARSACCPQRSTPCRCDPHLSKPEISWQPAQPKWRIHLLPSSFRLTDHP